MDQNVSYWYDASLHENGNHKLTSYCHPPAGIQEPYSTATTRNISLIHDTHEEHDQLTCQDMHNYNTVTSVLKHATSLHWAAAEQMDQTWGYWVSHPLLHIHPSRTNKLAQSGSTVIWGLPAQTPGHPARNGCCVHNIYERISKYIVHYMRYIFY